MTYGQAMTSVLSLLNETKPAADLKERIRMFLNDGQREVALNYPIWKSAEYTPEDEKVLPYDCYRPVWVITDGARFQYRPDTALPDTFTLEYEATPTDIPENPSDNMEFDTPDEAMPAVIFYAAAMYNSTEDDQRPFTTFYAMYQGKMGNLSNMSKRPVGTVVTTCINL